MTPDVDPFPWLPPDFEPLEMCADGVRRTRAQVGANDDGRETLTKRIVDAQYGLIDRLPDDHWASDSDGFTTIIEVGSWAGANALRLQHAIPSAQIYCVDTWKGTPQSRADSTTAIAQAIGAETVYRTFLRNTREKLFRGIIPCRGTSLFWAGAWPFPVSAVFIDADHSYEAVKADVPAWWPHVLPGGVLCGHDYHLFHGVRLAVDEWAAANDFPVIVEGECWFVYKMPAGAKPCVTPGATSSAKPSGPAG